MSLLVVGSLPVKLTRRRQARERITFTRQQKACTSSAHSHSRKVTYETSKPLNPFRYRSTNSSPIVSTSHFHQPALNSTYSTNLPHKYPHNRNTFHTNKQCRTPNPTMQEPLLSNTPISTAVIEANNQASSGHHTRYGNTSSAATTAGHSLSKAVGRSILTATACEMPEQEGRRLQRRGRMRSCVAEFSGRNVYTRARNG